MYKSQMFDIKINGKKLLSKQILQNMLSQWCQVEWTVLLIYNTMRVKQV